MDDDFGDGDGFDDDDLTSAAYLERQRELCDGLPSGKHDSKELADIFYKMLKEKKDANQLMDKNVQVDLVKEAERLEIKDKATLVLTELLLTKDNILSDIKQYRVLFLRFCHQNPKAQKYLLGGFEKLVGDVFKDELFNNSMKILKQFYDEDILEEEAIMDWAKKPSKKYITKEMSKKLHEKVEPFIKWLKEAEVDSDDEKQAANGNAAASNSRGNSKNSNEEEDDDDEEEEHSQPAKTAAKTGVSQGNERKQSLEDDDDEDEDFLEFSHRVSGIKLVDANTATSTNTKQQQQASSGVTTGGAKLTHSDEEDLDIDNI